MKKVMLFSCAALCAFLMNIGAQPPQPPSPEEMAKRETESMKTELKLNDEQLKKVEVINLKYAQKMSELFAQGPGGDFAEMQQKMGEIQKQKRVEFEKVLTKDQMTGYDAMMEERRKNMPGPPM